MTAPLWTLLIVQLLAALLAVRSLVEGVKFLRFTIDALADPPGSEADLPPAMVIAPVKAGDDLAVERHVANLLAQDHPAFRVRFVVESESDPAWQPLVWAAEANPDRVEVVVAELADGCSQKVHNLRAAMASILPDVGVLAFVDADVDVAPDWLRRLSAALAGEDPPAASTGYRHYVAERPTPAACWTTAWNGQILTLFGRHKAPFAWGGSWAIRTGDFRDMGIHDAWAGQLSDDYAATQAIRSAGGRIDFVPQCIGPSEPPRTWAAAWRFVVRQLAITARNSGRLFAVGYVIMLMHTLGMWAGAIGGAAAMAAGRTGWGIALLASAGVVLACGLGKNLLRTRAVELILPGHRRAIAANGSAVAWGYAPFMLLSLAAMTRAAFCHTIRWRDATYRLGKGGRVVAMRRGR